MEERGGRGGRFTLGTGGGGIFGGGGGRLVLPVTGSAALGASELSNSDNFQEVCADLFAVQLYARRVVRALKAFTKDADPSRLRLGSYHIS